MMDREPFDAWWMGTFSIEERETIEANFNPLGGITAAQVLKSEQPDAVATVSCHLNKENVRHLGYRILARAHSLLTKKTPVIEQHFFWHARGEFFYRWRDVDDFAMDAAIESFKAQIELSKRAAPLLAKSIGFVPGHAGFRQLRIIEEKRGNLMAARALCEEAKAGGWNDDWDKRIAAIDKKLAKQAQKGRI